MNHIWSCENSIKTHILIQGSFNSNNKTSLLLSFNFNCSFTCIFTTLLFPCFLEILIQYSKNLGLISFHHCFLAFWLRSSVVSSHQFNFFSYFSDRNIWKIKVKVIWYSMKVKKFDHEWLFLIRVKNTLAYTKSQAYRWCWVKRLDYGMLQMFK